MHKHICEYCNKEFENNRKIAKYCSNECKFHASRKKIECLCDNCNKIIYKKRDEYEKNKHHFCSQQCHYEFINFGNEEVICKNCGKHFIIFPSEKNKYLCSESCRITWLKENVYTKEEYREKHIQYGRKSFYEKYNNMNTDIELLEEYKNAKTKILCSCKIHADVTFKMYPSHIINGQTGCIKCFSQKSYNEILINDFLTSYNYNFTRQKTFQDCVDIRPLPFDFYLEDFNIAIEYDGEGHEKPIPRGNMSMEEAIKELENVKRRDKIKTEYCENNNIKLIRIPYIEQDNLLYYLWDKLVENKAIIEK